MRFAGKVDGLAAEVEASQYGAFARNKIDAIIPTLEVLAETSAAPRC